MFNKEDAERELGEMGIAPYPGSPQTVDYLNVKIFYREAREAGSDQESALRHARYRAGL